MMRSHVRLAYLLAGYLENSLSAVEKDEFSTYVDDPVFAEELKDLLATSFQHTAPEEMPQFGKTKVLERVLGPDYSLQAQQQQPVYRKLWFKAGLVAAMLICVIAAGLFYNRQIKNRESISVYANDVAPGTQGATLTLADGSTIKLSAAVNGEIAEEAGVKISKSADGQLMYEIEEAAGTENAIHTLSTARGETYKLKLPDGTLVHLNAASSLTYSSHLMNGAKRKVILSGEGFFDVAKDKTHPFVVECKGQEVEVLGTHFNIKGYTEDGLVTTTLLEGSVKVRQGNDQEIIEPGQQVINDERWLLVRDADLRMAVAWKEGYFRFDETPVREIMEQLARWYNLTIVYEGIQQTEGISGQISRGKPLSEVLHMLENTGLMTFKIEGRRVTVRK